MPDLVFRLAIPREEIMRYYEGRAQTVFVQALDGRTVSFPAAALREFVTHIGVHGVFRLCYDARGRMERLEQLRLPEDVAPTQRSASRKSGPSV